MTDSEAFVAWLNDDKRQMIHNYSVYKREAKKLLEVFEHTMVITDKIIAAADRDSMSISEDGTHDPWQLGYKAAQINTRMMIAQYIGHLKNHIIAIASEQ